MENVYAAMLLHKAGKEINEENVTNVLTAAGITVEAVQVKALVASKLTLTRQSKLLRQ